MLTRWKPRGLSERATLESLQEEKITPLRQTFGDLADFAKMSFSGIVPTFGKVGQQASRPIDELSGNGAIPARPSPRAKEVAA